MGNHFLISEIMLSDESQEAAIENIKFITGSDTRIKILYSLKDGALDLGSVRNDTGINSSTLLHAMNKLEENNLMAKGKDGYHLTHLGRIQLMILIDLIKTMSALCLHKDFWLNHQIDDIPEPLLKELGDLVESDIVRATSINLLKPMSVIAEAISKAKTVMGVVSIFQQGFLEYIEDLAMRDSDVKLILTEELFDMLKNEHISLLRDILSKDNFEIWVTDRDVKVAFVVTDSAFLLGLFRNDDTYDMSENLVSHSKEAISWGMKLFKHHLGGLNCVHTNDI